MLKAGSERKEIWNLMEKIMNIIENIQENLKNKIKTCFIIDYNEILSDYTKNFSDTNFNPMAKRILENFGKKKYIQVIILGEKNDLKVLKKVKFSAPDLDFFDNETFLKKFNKINKKSEVIYFGCQEIVGNIIKQNDGKFIGIFPLDKACEKLADGKISK